MEYNVKIKISKSKHEELLDIMEKLRILEENDNIMELPKTEEELFQKIVNMGMNKYISENIKLYKKTIYELLDISEDEPHECKIKIIERNDNVVAEFNSEKDAQAFVNLSMAIGKKYKLEKE
ncbi:hypothetical protein [Eubacterium sp.]|uniref:hypothetical protein n=1 Tax=Eubacterium sp. TaxID=142586 RepID=UPI0025DD8E26|nr:hypothetical protein [Eubacterium sp.]MCR5628627.1 hypothetical protein [Eubacterium sp.]